jgi:hypothetical protein
MDTREIVQDERSMSILAVPGEPLLCRSKRAVANFSRSHLIDVAPHPGFAGLDGTNQRVLGVMEMLGRVLILRRIAAADVATFETKAQMNPGVASLHAILTNVLVGLRHVNLIGVFALHNSPF